MMQKQINVVTFRYYWTAKPPRHRTCTPVRRKTWKRVCTCSDEWQRVRNVRRRVRRAENVRRKSHFSRAQHEYRLFFLADQILVDPNERLQSIIESSHANFLEKSTFSKHLFLYFFKKFNLDMVEKDELASRQMDLMRPYLLSTRSNPYSNHRLRHGSCSHTQSENYSIQKMKFRRGICKTHVAHVVETVFRNGPRGNFLKPFEGIFSGRLFTSELFPYARKKFDLIRRFP